MTSSDRHLDDAHRRMLELLPWLANGSLAGEERRELEKHLASCADCRAERVRLESLAAAVQASEDLPLSMESSLSAMRKRVAAQSGVSPQSEAAGERPTSGIAKRWLQRRGPLYGARPTVRQLVTATPWVLAAVLALALVRTGSDVGRPTVSGTVQTASIGDAQKGVASDEPRFSVLADPAAATIRFWIRFDDDASQGEVRLWLHSLGANIVDGPTVQGVFTLELAEPDGDPDALLALLGDSGLVVSVLRAPQP